MNTSLMLFLALSGQAFAQVEFTYRASEQRAYCGRAPVRDSCPARYQRAGRGSSSSASAVRSNAQALMEADADAWDRAHGGNNGSRLKEAIISRASTLRSYWTGHGSSARSSLRSGFPSAIRRMAENPDADGNLQELAIRIANAAIHAAAPVLASATRPDIIMEAASYWWAARAMQLLFGCDEAREMPRRSGEPLIIAQFSHQACRRIYMRNSYEGLAEAARDGEFSLDMASFSSAYALGSRTERAELFSRAIQVFENRDGGASSEDRRILQAELDQVNAELDRRQVLTWNGYQPADSDDVRRLEGLRSRLREFLGRRR